MRYFHKYFLKICTFASSVFLTGVAQAQGIDAAIDKFFNDYLGWFANLIFTSVPVAGTKSLSANKG